MVDKPLLIPELVTLKEIRDLNADTVLMEVELSERRSGKAFSYLPGQFAELSVFGVGECPISFTSTPTRPTLEFAVRDAGMVTHALHSLDRGEELGLRGPFGNGFPVDDMKGRDILFVAGGIGLAPLRSVINYVLDRRPEYGRIDIVYGARSPQLLCFTEEYDTWRGAPGCDLYLTIDAGSPGWKGRVGFVPQVVKEIGLPAEGRIAVVCGPPIMIKIVLAELVFQGYAEGDILTTLELKMKCGIGKCGRCNIGPKYVCLDGPVFRLSELGELPEEF